MEEARSTRSFEASLNTPSSMACIYRCIVEGKAAVFLIQKVLACRICTRTYPGFDAPIGSSLNAHQKQET